MTRDINNTRGLSPCATILCNRFVVTLLLMMVVGVSEVKGQTDYSGVYYIANAIWNGDHESGKSGYEDYWYDVNKPDKNWYLVPGNNPQRSNKEDAWYSPDYTTQNGSSETPFLTTFRTNRDYNSIWIIKKTGNYYYIIHALTGKYVKYEPPYINGVSGQTNNNNCHRKAIHLEAWTDPDNDPGDVFKYEITTNTNTTSSVTGFNIKYTGTLVSGSHRYFNPSGDNWEYYYGKNNKAPYSLGMVGLWTEEATLVKGALWPHEDAKAALTPTINVNAELGSFTITPPVATYINPEDVGSTITKPAGFLPPGCSIRYTTGDGSQAAPTATTGVVYDALNPPTIDGFTNVKAAIFGYGMQLSLLSNAMLNQTITLSDESFVYNGLERRPTVTLKYGDNTIPADEYNVEYSNNTNAGTPTVTVSNKVGGDFYVITDSKNFTITKAPLTVTAVAHSFTYGNPLTGGNGVTFGVDDGNGGIINGFVNSETSTVLGGSLDYDYSYTLYGNVDGNYTITPKGLTSDNYEFTYVAGALTINQKEVGLTWSETPLAYNGSAQAPTATATGLVNNDAIGVTVTGAQTNVGMGYTATASELTGEKAGNYKLPTANTTTFAISKAALTITADDKNVIYGSAAPTYTYSYSGFVNDETAEVITTAPTVTCSYTSNSNAGTYDIVPSGGEATNYSFTYENGTLTVEPKTVKDDPDTEAGESAVTIVMTDIPEGNFTYDGTAKTPTVTVKDGETVIALSEYTLDFSDNTNAGTATVTITDNDGGNYQVSGATTFTINPAALTITPDNGQSKSFGDPDPELTFTSEGLVEGDALTGALGRVAGEDAGTYAIIQGTLDNTHNPNYTITVITTGKTFTITAKSLGSGTTPAENITIEITEADEDHVTVKQGGTPLRVGTTGTDYDYSISSTTGSATTKYYEVTIEGANNYTGSFTTKFANVTFGTKNNHYYWGTFVSNSNDGNFAVPSNMEAYIVTGINASAGTVEVEQLDNIPDHVPVLLLTNKNAHGFIVKDKDGGTGPTGTNLLLEAASNMDVTTAQMYLLYKGEFVLNAAGTLPAGRVYLPKPGGTSAPAILTINWDATTGIDNTQLSTSDTQFSGTWYTLEGIKLNGRPTKRGLYLRDGKKIVVK